MLPLSAIPSIRPDILPRADLMPPGIREPLDGARGAQGTQGVQGASAPSGDFAGMLGRMVQEVSSKQHAAAETVSQLQSGGNVSLHQAVIAMEEASVSFQLMVEVRNKLLESYQEIMRMHV